MDYNEYCPMCGTRNESVSSGVCSVCGSDLEKLAESHEDKGPKQNPPPVVEQGADFPGYITEHYSSPELIHTTPKSRIYRALEVSSGRRVVIKELESRHTDPRKNLEIEENLKKSVLLFRGFEHRGLPSVYSAFKYKNRFFIIKEYVDGESLAVIMKNRQNRPFSQGEIIQWFLQLMEIIDYLHTRTPPYVHKNIQPSNIMIDKSGDVHLIDYDMDRIVSDRPEDRLQGIPGFMAPEQFNDSEEPRSDIYSAGMLIRYLLTGIDPSDEKNRFRRYKRISDINSGVERWLDNLTLKMVEKIPKDRPSSSGEIIDEIRLKKDQPEVELVSRPNVAVSAPPVVENMKPGQKKGSRDSRCCFCIVVIAVCALIALALVIIVPWFAVKERSKKGLELYRQGKYAESQPILERSARVFRTNPEILLALGVCQSRDGNYDTAIMNFQRAEKYARSSEIERIIRKETATACYGLAVKKAEDGDMEGALQNFTKAFAMEPELKNDMDGKSLYFMGLTLMHRKDYPGALNHFNACVEKDKTPDVFLARAGAYLKMEKLAPAVADMQKAMTLGGKGDLSNVEKKIGEMKSEALDLAKKSKDGLEFRIIALENLRDMIHDKDIDRVLSEFYVEKAHNRSYTEEKSTRSIDDLKKALKYDPSSSKAYREMGEAYLAQEDYGKALNAYRKALELDKTGYNAPYLKSRIRYMESVIKSRKISAGRKTTAHSVARTPSAPVSHQGMEPYLILSNYYPTQYLVRDRAGNQYLLTPRKGQTGSSYLYKNRWYWGKSAGGQATIYIPNYRNEESPYQFDFQKLSRISVALVSSPKARTQTGYTPYSTPGKNRRSTYSSGKARITLRTDEGSTLFIETSPYQLGDFRQGMVCYGQVDTGQVILYMGDYYQRKVFPLSGSAGSY